jgi:hypothetical protein
VARARGKELFCLLGVMHVACFVDLFGVNFKFLIWKLNIASAAMTSDLAPLLHCVVFIGEAATEALPQLRQRPISPEITGPIPADGRPMPAAEQPAAMATHVIPMGMDMPVSLPMMPLYAIVTCDNGRHKHQRANYSRDEANSV